MYDTYHYKYFRFFSQNYEVTLTPLSVHFGFMSHQFLGTTYTNWKDTETVG